MFYVREIKMLLRRVQPVHELLVGNIAVFSTLFTPDKYDIYGYVIGGALALDGMIRFAIAQRKIKQNQYEKLYTA